jgi:hypothetical protein
VDRRSRLIGFGSALLRDEAIDGGFKVVDGSEDAAHQAPAREFGEKALDGVEPGCGGRGEVERGWRASHARKRDAAKDRAATVPATPGS